MSWKRSDLKGVLQRLGLAFGVSLLCAALGLLMYNGSLLKQVVFFIGLLAGFWLILGSLKTLAERVNLKGEGRLRRFLGLPLATHGMILAHIGLGVFVLGAVVEGHTRLSLQQAMQVGDRVSLGRYEMTLTGAYRQQGANYDAQGAVFSITRDGKQVCEPRPQRRFYPASNSVQSKVWLCFQPLNDLYVVLSQPQDNHNGVPAWQVRWFYNPWVRLIFVGPLLMALGGLLSLGDRRLRLGVATRAKALREVVT